MPYVIENASPSDMSALLGLESLFPSDLIRERQFRYHMRNPRALLLVARRAAGGEAVGYALFLVRQQRYARFYSLIVQPSERGRGLGRDLCRTALAMLAGRGVTTVGLEVDAADTGAIGLYRSLGFAEVARVADYYEDGRDAVRMKYVMEGV